MVLDSSRSDTEKAGNIGMEDGGPDVVDAVIDIPVGNEQGHADEGKRCGQTGIPVGVVLQNRRFVHDEMPEDEKRGGRERGVDEEGQVDAVAPDAAESGQQAQPYLHGNLVGTAPPCHPVDDHEEEVHIEERKEEPYRRVEEVAVNVLGQDIV